MEDKPNIILGILSILFPIVGIVLFFVVGDEKPRAANAYLGYGILGFTAALMLLLT